MSMLRPVPDPIVRKGTVLLPEMIVEYDILQPAPTQWVAIGVARSLKCGRRRMAPGLVTGTGTTETEAIRELCYRLAAPTSSAVWAGCSATVVDELP